MFHPEFQAPLMWLQVITDHELGLEASPEQKLWPDLQRLTWPGWSFFGSWNEELLLKIEKVQLEEVDKFLVSNSLSSFFDGPKYFLFLQRSLLAGSLSKLHKRYWLRPFVQRLLRSLQKFFRSGNFFIDGKVLICSSGLKFYRFKIKLILSNWNRQLNDWSLPKNLRN